MGGMWTWAKGKIGESLSGEGLKAKVFRGSMWLGTGLITEQVLRFGRNMLLTRLLAPAAFGTMAIVSSATLILHTIMDIGVKNAIIQNPRGHEEEYVNAAWCMAFVRGLIFAAILCTLAPAIAAFYGNPEISRLLRLCSIGIIADGAMSTKVYVAIKEMRFKKFAIVNHVGGICGVLFTIVLSFFLRSVLALVIGAAAESIARTTLSFALCPFLPRLKITRDAMADLWKFSRGMMGLSFLNLIFSQTDIFVLGKMRSPADLGLYTMAVYLIQTPTSFVMNLLGQTVLPAFARVQDDKARINRILFKTTRAIVLVGMPALVFAFFCGRALLTLAYGVRYSAATGPFIVASAVALLNLLNGQLTSIFFATGRPNLHRYSIIVMAAVMTLLIYPFVHLFGIIGGQLSCLAAVSVGFVLQAARVHELIGFQLLPYAKAILTGAAVSLSVVAVCLGTRAFPLATRPLPNLVIGAAGCLIACGISATITWRSEKMGNAALD